MPTGEVLPIPATPRVTLPPTTTIDGQDDSRPGSGFGWILLLLVGITMVIGILTPVPARIRRRDGRK
jgi:hypothetical protein